MSWFAVKRERLVYRGRVTREPFTEWLDTREGSGRLDATAAAFRFRLLARSRARKRLWRSLEQAARSAPVRSALAAETGHFGAAMSAVSYAPGLPRAHVALRRLVLVPRALVAARARAGARVRLWNLPELAGVDESVRAFFCEQFLIEMDRALESWRPGPARAFPAPDGWACVGTDRAGVWVDPLWSGAHWSGHFFMYELPRTPLSRAQRRDLDAAVAGLQQGSQSLSRLQREALVRTAADGLGHARAG